uniref:Uncharacterized protein n=1 Tax=Odontella aurita TaxID=265563 RepID=A0A7S4IVE6_9STRA
MPAEFVASESSKQKYIIQMHNDHCHLPTRKYLWKRICQRTDSLGEHGKTNEGIIFYVVPRPGKVVPSDRSIHTDKVASGLSSKCRHLFDYWTIDHAEFGMCIDP